MKRITLGACLSLVLPLAAWAQYGSLNKSIASYEADSPSLVALGIFGQGQPQLTIIGFELDCPAGWSYAGAATPGAGLGVVGEPAGRPGLGATGTLVWNYPTPPPAENSAQFVVWLEHAPGLTGYQTFAGRVVFRGSNGAILKQSLGGAIFSGVTKPVFATPPAGASITVGASVSFTAALEVASSFGLTGFQWHKDGIPLAGKTAFTLTLPAVRLEDAGRYTAVATNPAGVTTSAAATLLVAPAAIPSAGGSPDATAPGRPEAPALLKPAIVAGPASRTVSAGENVVLAAEISGAPAPALQWWKDGIAIAGATAAKLNLSGVTPADGGNYVLVATNAAGSVTSTAAALSVRFSKLVNVSTLTSVGSGDGVILGFTFAGEGAKKLLLRAAGPSLANFAVAAPLTAPQLTLFDARGQLLARNAGWGGAAALAEAFAQTGAFRWPEGSADAALLTSPLAGGTSLEVRGVNNAGGVTLAEIYDLNVTAGGLTRLVNVSARATVAKGGVFTTGFVVAGNTPIKVLVRAAGPALAAFGVPNVLARPRLTLFNGAGGFLAGNEGWGGGAELAAAFAQAGAFSWPENSADAALVASLQPGSYSAQVVGTDGEGGALLVEVYELR